MKDLVFDLINNEKKRQSDGLELIPSENYVSKDVLAAMGSILTNKYSEGYPSFEGVPGWSEDEIADTMLMFSLTLALRLIMLCTLPGSKRVTRCLACPFRLAATSLTVHR